MTNEKSERTLPKIKVSHKYLYGVVVSRVLGVGYATLSAMSTSFFGYGGGGGGGGGVGGSVVGGVNVVGGGSVASADK